MWLLSTSRAELHEFTSPEAVPGGYAILSHVWDEGEQSFQVTQWLREICAKTGANPRDHSYPKIRSACILAESHGYKWLWADTSCIDKSSSAGLSEAINSMYRYYSLAKMCYAYLRDVPSGTYLLQRGSAFYRSKWHTRGWTLQELIAPTFVLFLADNWTNLGTKAELAGLLETITHVPAGLLRLQTRLADYSLAQRMSWAASRQTTRPEDRAYSLLGIFGINMSTLYGEGKQAFYRLQEEIMKRFVDTTLFAWGSMPSRLLAGPGRRGGSTQPFLLTSSDPSEPHVHTEDSYLLAPSPASFHNCGSVTFTPPTVTGHHGKKKRLRTREHSGTPTFSITPYGVLAHIPLIEDWDEDSEEVTAHLFWSNSHGAPLGLRLKPCSTSADPFRPHYDIVGGRLVPLSRDSQGRLMNGPELVHLSWQEIYITHRPPPESIVHEHANKLYVPMNLGSFVPFRISNEAVDALPTSPLAMELTACISIPLPWDGNPPVILQFEIRTAPYRIAPTRYYAMLHLGRCTTSSAHWAAVRFTTSDLATYTPSQGSELHDCLRDHINTWPGLTKTFPFQDADDTAEDSLWWESSIILRFDTCPVNPLTTLITHITTKKIQTSPAPQPLSTPFIPPTELINTTTISPRAPPVSSGPPAPPAQEEHAQEEHAQAVVVQPPETPVIPPRPVSHGLMPDSEDYDLDESHGTEDVSARAEDSPGASESDTTPRVAVRREADEQDEAVAFQAVDSDVGMVGGLLITWDEEDTRERDERAAEGSAQEDHDNGLDRSVEGSRNFSEGAVTTPTSEPQPDDTEVRKEDEATGDVLLPQINLETKYLRAEDTSTQEEDALPGEQGEDSTDKDDGAEAKGSVTVEAISGEVAGPGGQASTGVDEKETRTDDPDVVDTQGEVGGLNTVAG